jgi:hypothetical protein
LNEVARHAPQFTVIKKDVLVGIALPERHPMTTADSIRPSGHG